MGYEVKDRKPGLEDYLTQEVGWGRPPSVLGPRVKYTAGPPREASFNSLGYTKSLCDTLTITTVPCVCITKTTKLEERICSRGGVDQLFKAKAYIRDFLASNCVSLGLMDPPCTSS